MGRGALLDLLVEGDFDPAGRAAIPGAVRSALSGDPAPLLRLVQLVLGAGRTEPPRLFDVGDLRRDQLLPTSGFPWSPPLRRPAGGTDVDTAAQQIPGLRVCALRPRDRACFGAAADLRLLAAGGRAP